MFRRSSIPIAIATFVMGCVTAAIARAVPPCEWSWQPSPFAFPGPGFDDQVSALCTDHRLEGDVLYAAGWFNVADGQPLGGVARWDGSDWQPLGAGIRSGPADHVECLRIFDNGSGPRLIAGGSFVEIGGVPASNIAAWDGGHWAPLGAGLADTVAALEIFQGQLVAGGKFTALGDGTPVSHVARWNGSSWSALAGDADVDLADLSRLLIHFGERC